MQVRDVMTTDFAPVPQTDNLVAASELMRSLDVGVLPVIDAEETWVGVITDRDIVVRGLANGHHPVTTEVSEIMTPRGLSCDAALRADKATELMEQENVGRLLVTEDGKPVGIVSRRALRTKPVPESEKLAELLHPKALRL